MMHPLLTGYRISVTMYRYCLMHKIMIKYALCNEREYVLECNWNRSICHFFEIMIQTTSAVNRSFEHENNTSPQRVVLCSDILKIQLYSTYVILYLPFMDKKWKISSVKYLWGGYHYTIHEIERSSVTMTTTINISLSHKSWMWSISSVLLYHNGVAKRNALPVVTKYRAELKGDVITKPFL